MKGAGGLGLMTVLFVVFLVLKLVGVIAWSWWWVTAPLWLQPVLYIGFFALTFLVYAAKHRGGRRR